MTLSFLLFLLIGYVFIRLGKKFFSEINESRVKQLIMCTECSGVYIYTFLGFVMGEQLFREIFYVPVISEVATGGIVAILIHLLELGWGLKFGVIELE